MDLKSVEKKLIISIEYNELCNIKKSIEAIIKFIDNTEEDFATDINRLINFVNCIESILNEVRDY